MDMVVNLFCGDVTMKSYLKKGCPKSLVLYLSYR